MTVKPFDSIPVNRLETFNEVSILLLAYHLPCVSNFLTNPLILDQIGWSIITLLCFNITANIALILYQAVRLGKLKVKAEI